MSDPCDVVIAAELASAADVRDAEPHATAETRFSARGTLRDDAAKTIEGPAADFALVAHPQRSAAAHGKSDRNHAATADEAVAMRDRDVDASVGQREPPVGRVRVFADAACAHAMHRRDVRARIEAEGVATMAVGSVLVVATGDLDLRSPESAGPRA
jgi:hypothetical protein